MNQRRGEDGAEWELHLTRPWTPVTVPDEPLTVEILEPALNRITSTCILRFELRAGRKLSALAVARPGPLWREMLVAHATSSAANPCARPTLPANAAICSRSAMPLAELPARCRRLSNWPKPSPRGAPLTARAIRLKPVLARGQLADAVVRDGAMVISLKVEVLEEGVPGQMVRVRNPQSRRELRGKVQDEQTIAIPL